MIKSGVLFLKNSIPSYIMVLWVYIVPDEVVPSPFILLKQKHIVHLPPLQVASWHQRNSSLLFTYLNSKIAVMTYEHDAFTTLDISYYNINLLLMIFVATQDTAITNPSESSIDQAPYVSVMDDGMVTAVTNEPPSDVGCEQAEHTVVPKDNAAECNDVITPQEANATTEVPEHNKDVALPPVRISLNQLSRRSKASIWLLAYVAIITTLPILGSVLPLLFKKRVRNIISGLLQRK